MKKIVIVGGGWSGCAAAISAKKAGGDEVVLLERTDMLLGTGLVGGIMRNNGRHTAAEEIIAMGCGDLFEICDKCSRHTNIEFPGHKHANLYDIVKTQVEVINHLNNLGIKIFFNTRITKADMKDNQIINVQDSNGILFRGDVFIDATGTAGPMDNCTKYGNGCAMCILRCPSFGGRVSLTHLAGIKESIGIKANGSFGAMSGSCKLNKESLSEEIQKELNQKGVVVIPLDKDFIEDHLNAKACQQYALPPFKDNIILLDTGHAKMMTPFYDLQTLRKIPGFEFARYEDPYAGGKGNSMRYFAMAPRDNYLKVEGAENLFCCGEKTGLFVGHTEAIATGTLAGHNSVRYVLKKDLFQIPECLATGDAISFVKEKMQTKEGMCKKYTFSGSIYFKRMKKLGIYITDKNEIIKRVEECGAKNIFGQKLN